MAYWNSDTTSPHYSKSHYRKKAYLAIGKVRKPTSDATLIPDCSLSSPQGGMFVIARRCQNPVPRNWALSYWSYCNLWLSWMLGTKRVASYASWHLLSWRDKYVISAKLKNKIKQKHFFLMAKYSSWKERVWIEKCLLTFACLTIFHKSHQNKRTETWECIYFCYPSLPLCSA